MEWMILPFKRYAEFGGRSRRLEFWMFWLLNLIVYSVLFAIWFAGFPLDEIANGTMPPPPPETAPPQVQMDWLMGMFGPTFWLGFTLMGLWWLVSFVPMLAVTVRRLHDRGMSGWWYAGLLIASFIPIVSVIALPGYLVLLVVLLLDGQEGENKWGLNPKDPKVGTIFE